MAIVIPVDGVDYEIPTAGENGWASKVNAFFQALAAASTDATDAADAATIAATAATAAAAAATAAAGAISLESLGGAFGNFGQRAAGSRIWGVCAKTDGQGTGIQTLFLDTPDTLGSANIPNYDDTGRFWNYYQTASSDNAVAGLRAPAAHQFYWKGCPRLQTLLRTPDSGVSEGPMTNMRIWVALTDGDLDQVANSDSIRYVGFRYDTDEGDTSWKVCLGNGTTHNEIDTGVEVLAATEYFFDLNLEDPLNLVATVNGVVTTKDTNLPVATGSLQGKWQATVTTLDTGFKVIRWHHTMLARK